MKYLLIPLALVACNAMSCPGDSAKEAMAPAVKKSVVAVKNATPATVAVKKASNKVAVKTSTEARKTTPL